MSEISFEKSNRDSQDFYRYNGPAHKILMLLAPEKNQRIAQEIEPLIEEFVSTQTSTLMSELGDRPFQPPSNPNLN